jgi:hypothetical protein
LVRVLPHGPRDGMTGGCQVPDARRSVIDHARNFVADPGGSGNSRRCLVTSSGLLDPRRRTGWSKRQESARRAAKGPGGIGARSALRTPVPPQLSEIGGRPPCVSGAAQFLIDAGRRGGRTLRRSVRCCGRLRRESLHPSALTIQVQ